MSDHFNSLRLVKDSAQGGAVNMAVDEALLTARLGPILRIYRWSERTVSLGYFNRFKDARRQYSGEVAMVRRWTGGGMVDHDADETWTYALAIPSGCAWARFRSRDLYAQLHGVLAEVIGGDALGDQVANQELGGPCFSNPVPGDLMREQEKIAGAALRRSRDGILAQGSIRNVARDDTFPEVFANRLSGSVTGLKPFEDVAGFKESVRHLIESKYGTAEWLKVR